MKVPGNKFNPTGRACYALFVVVVLMAGLLALELAVRHYPGLLPAWYRGTLPANAVELFSPGILQRTPIEGVPLPFATSALLQTDGAAIDVPSDLVDIGLVGEEENPDGKTYGKLEIQIDDMGFPNYRELSSPDLVFLGDSFTLATGIISPPGLQLALEQATGLSVFNISLSGIGPLREEWLLQNVALPLKPRAIIWFIFGGNDVQNAATVSSYRERGIVNYAQLFKDHEYPGIYVFDILKKRFQKKAIKMTTEKKPLPGLYLKGSKNAGLIWFYPLYLRNLAMSKEQWVNEARFSITKETIRRVRDKTMRNNIKLIVVYVPTKAQVYLPYVKEDAGLLYEMAVFDLIEPHVYKRETFFPKALRNRNNLEKMFTVFCAEEGIACLSLTRPLEALARTGELGYLAADTHWNHLGQRAALRPLLDALIKAGVLTAAAPANVEG